MSRRADPGYLLPHRETVLAVAGLFAGVFLATLSQTSVVTVLPVIAGELGGFDRYSWVVTVYFLCSIVAAPAYGALSDSYGRRPFAVAAIVIFVIGSVIATLAESMNQLVAARGIQGIGAGGIIPLGNAVIGDLVPASDRGRWQAMLGLTMGCSTVAGPIVGGWLTEVAGWRWTFASMVPIGLVALGIVAATLRIPPHPERVRGVDYVGLALFGGGVTCLIVTVGQQAPRASLQTAAGGVAALLLLAAFWRHERSTTAPILPPATMKVRTFRLLAAASFAIGGAMLGALLYLPLFLQGVLGESAATAGLLFSSFMLANVAASLFTGFSIARSGHYRWVLISGPALMAAAAGLMATLGPGSSMPTVILAMTLFGFGLGFVIQNVMLVAQNAVPSRHLGAATGTIHLLRNLGGVLGVSAMAAVLAATLQETGAGGVVLGAGGVSPEALASGLRVVFLINVPLLLLALWFVLRVDWVPLQEVVRGDMESFESPSVDPWTGAAPMTGPELTEHPDTTERGHR